MLYASTSLAGAIGEAFGNLAEWSPRLFVTPAHPGGTRALAVYELEDRLLDPDDPKALLDRDLRPSRIVTRDRTVTQRWALGIFEEGRWAGVSWWSFWNPAWASCGVWSIDRLVLVGVEPLTDRLDAVHAARETLARPWHPD